jgi:hypothetical protein
MHLLCASQELLSLSRGNDFDYPGYKASGFAGGTAKAAVETKSMYFTTPSTFSSVAHITHYSFLVDSFRIPRALRLESLQ